MRPRQALIFLGGGIVFILVFGALYLLDAHARDTLIPQILVPIGIVLAAIGAIGLVRSKQKRG